MLAEPGVALLLVPPEARAAFAAAWPWFALSQPINAVSFVTDGVHWGAKDYAYLRNGMLLSGAIGIALLEGVGRYGPSSLAAVWAVTLIWLIARAGFGWIRIWPAVGRAPLGGADAQAARVQ